MQTTIDGAGRIVVPKALRDSLRFMAGQQLNIAERNGVLEIEPMPTPMHLKERGGCLVAIPDIDLPELTPELVRETLEQIRR